MQKISDLLGSEDGLNRIRQMAQLFGLGADEVDAGLSSASGMFSQEEQDGQSGTNKQSGTGHMPDLGGLGDLLGGIDLQKIMKLLSAYSSTQDGESECLLRALKPMLSERRQGRVDEAINLMKLIAILPLVKESGLLGSLLG